MANRDNPKATATGGTSSDASAAATAQGSAKAQAEFQRYKARMAAGQGAAQGPGPAQGNPVYMVPIGYSQPGAGPVPGWAFPPSLAPLIPNAGGGGPGPGPIETGVVAAGSLADRLGSTLRLGLDVLNAALAGSARMIGGAYGAQGGYGYGDQGYGHGHGHGCGCSCCDDCCGSDCCGCDSCCAPSVGRCC